MSSNVSKFEIISYFLIDVMYFCQEYCKGKTVPSFPLHIRDSMLSCLGINDVNFDHLKRQVASATFSTIKLLA